MSNKKGTEVPEEVILIMGFIDTRIADITSRERITPWNKAKLMAFEEVRAVIAPPAEPVTEVTSAQIEAPTPAVEVPDAIQEATDPITEPVSEVPEEPAVRHGVVEHAFEPIF